MGLRNNIFLQFGPLGPINLSLSFCRRKRDIFPLTQRIESLDIALFGTGNHQRIDRMVAMIQPFVPVTYLLLLPMSAVVFPIFNLRQTRRTITVKIEIM